MNSAHEGTLPEDDAAQRTPAPTPRAMAVMVAWSADEPWRVGELAVVTAGIPHVFGRGEAEPGERATRLRFRRRHQVTGPLEGARISRTQLELTSTGTSLSIENRGRLKLTVNGQSLDRATTRAGDVLAFGAQLVLLVTERSLTAQNADFPFAEPDADGLVGESDAIWELRRHLAFIAPRREHVLITGASGTGKELIARALHRRSSRASKTLVARNAPTLPEGLVDAELFGNARNYPNAGMSERPGLVGDADGSTLFLDEIAEVSPTLQAHLLRVLDGGEYQRLGDSRTRRSDLRLIAATNRPVAALKHDLAARLMFRIEVPDVNARRDDVPLLVRHVLRRIAKENPDVAARWFDSTPHGLEARTSPELLATLLRWPFTTHVRELEGLLWRALTHSRGERLELHDSPGSVEAPLDTEAARLQRALDEHNGVIEDAWRALGLSSRHALSRLISKHGLEVRRRHGPE